MRPVGLPGGYLKNQQKPMNNQQARSSVDGVGDAGCAEEVAWS